MAHWKTSIRKASFRNVPFFVRATEGEFGRRTKAHEYPLRDKPYVEDMGRKARQFTVDALVLGADYMVYRDRLINALEQKGPGQLVHPYLGEMTASVSDVKMSETTEEGGSAKFSITFIESGAAAFPSSEPNRVAELKSAAERAIEAAKSSFVTRYSVAGKPQFVAAASQSMVESAIGQMTSAVGSVRAVADEVAALQRDVDAVRRDIITVLYTPASVAHALVGNLQQLVQAVTSLPRDMLGLARIFYTFGEIPKEVSPDTTSRRAQATNEAETTRLVRTTAAAEGARAAAALEFDSYQDAIAVRDELLDVFDDLMLSDPPDALYDALRALRAAVVRDIASRGADLARLVTWTPRATTPTLVVAQTLYGDATREAELVTRNLIRHPLFAPGAVPLEVLSDG